MAQVKVTEFFNSRKRTGDVHPSKRRKVILSDVTHSDALEQRQPVTSPAISTRTRGRRPKHVSLNVPNTQTTGSSVGTTKETSLGQNVAKKTEIRSRSRPVKTYVSVDTSQKTLTELFANKLGEKAGTSECNGSEGEKTDGIPEVLPTAACDDHCTSPPCSPSKRLSKSESGDVICSKRSRVNNRVRKDLMATANFQTADEGYDFSKFCPADSEKKPTRRKKVLLKKPSRAKQTISKADKEIHHNMLQKNCTSDEAAEAVPLNAKKEKMTPEKPVLSNPKEDRSLSKEDLISSTDKDVTTNALVLRASLTKCGKLSELKEKLAQYGKAKAKVEEEKKKKHKTGEKEKKREEPCEKSKPRKSIELVGQSKSVIIQDKAKISDPGNVVMPAYERFHALAEPVSPSLSLPFKYKFLEEIFSAMETIVSMLHNRSEICTFSKLQPAVEGIVRKRFDTKHIGKIITVYPDAYKLRQEKGLPSFGKKEHGYQLTVEAELKSTTVSENLANRLKSLSTPQMMTKDGKSNFSAAHILERKSTFHRNLIQIVKMHHKAFLSNLDVPLTVPDEKLNRWHPKFSLDEIEDVMISAVPQPPDVKKLTTAGQVLEETQGRINPRVKAALEKVSAKKRNSDISQKSVGELTKEEKRAANNSPKSSPPKPAANKCLSGVSMSLLERIRAKEAEKHTATMTRSVEDENKLQRMERLPDLVRILRSFFVTQKKPSISMEDAIQQLTDSSRSYMGKGEAEKHFQLIVDMLPEWITVIKISKGCFVKINKDKDVNLIISKINQKLKQSR